MSSRSAVNRNKAKYYRLNSEMAENVNWQDNVPISLFCVGSVSCWFAHSLWVVANFLVLLPTVSTMRPQNNRAMGWFSLGALGSIPRKWLSDKLGSGKLANRITYCLCLKLSGEIEKPSIAWNDNKGGRRSHLLYINMNVSSSNKMLKN